MNAVEEFGRQLDKEKKSEGGMFYTPPIFIHRMIDPLFYNDLKGRCSTLTSTGSPELGYTDALDSLKELDKAVFKAYGFIHDDGTLYTRDEALPLLIDLYCEYEAEEYD